MLQGCGTKLKSGFNLLPYDGCVDYYGCVFTDKEACSFFKKLERDVSWRHDEIIMFGKRITTKRRVAWYADKNFSYTYSKVTKEAMKFIPVIKTLKECAEDISGEKYNSCLLNFYRNGSEGMSWHSDDEKELKENGTIASISFGAERRFCFKNKSTKEKRELILENGSLMVMKGNTQRHWLHSLPAMKKVKQPRINLTFRAICE